MANEARDTAAQQQSGLLLLSHDLLCAPRAREPRALIERPSNPVNSSDQAIPSIHLPATASARCVQTRAAHEYVHDPS